MIDELFRSKQINLLDGHIRQKGRSNNCEASIQKISPVDNSYETFYICRMINAYD